MERNLTTAVATAKPARIGQAYTVVYTTVPRPPKPRSAKSIIARRPTGQSVHVGTRHRRHRAKADLAHLCATYR